MSQLSSGRRRYRRDWRLAAAAVAAIGVVGGAAAVAPHLTGHERARQVAYTTLGGGGGGSQPAGGSGSGAAAAPGVTAHTGPITPGSVVVHTGPGFSYPVTTPASAFTTYNVSCFWAAGITPGARGPYNLPDMTAVWYQLANPATPAQGIGWIQATTQGVTFSAPTASIPGLVGACPTAPPAPPPPPSSKTGVVVTAPGPLNCARGLLSPGDTSSISVHSASGHVDIEFVSAGAPMLVDVQDVTTGEDGSGIALNDPRPTWHFIEDHSTDFGDHTLSVRAEGALGGPNGEEAPGNGDTIDSTVSWEALTDGCTP